MGYIGKDTGAGSDGLDTGVGYTGVGYTGVGYTGVDTGVGNTGVGYTGVGYTGVGYTAVGGRSKDCDEDSPGGGPIATVGKAMLGLVP